MMEKSKIYTKGGDKGSTSLVGGKRVPKTHIRLDAYGTIDELNSFLGLLREEIRNEEDRNILLHIQNLLFSAGSYLATDTESGTGICGISASDIELLENQMDSMDNTLPQLNSFILPGGCKSNAIAHICRTICRRAERCIYKIQEVSEVDNTLCIFINRLSDYLFILARKLSLYENAHEIIWKNPCK